MSDARTLRLAHPSITPALLEQFIAHRRAHLERGLGDPSAIGSGIETNTFHQILVATQGFCGRRATALRLKERRATASPEQQKVIDETLLELKNDGPFEAEWGPENLNVLLSREAELVQLHVLATPTVSPRRPAG